LRKRRRTWDFADGPGAALEEGVGAVVAAGMGDGHAVGGGAELTVTAAVEAVRVRLAAAGGRDGTVPLCQAQATGLRKRRMSPVSRRVRAAVTRRLWDLRQFRHQAATRPSGSCSSCVISADKEVIQVS